MNRFSVSSIEAARCTKFSKNLSIFLALLCRDVAGLERPIVRHHSTALRHWHWFNSICTLNFYRPWRKWASPVWVGGSWWRWESWGNYGGGCGKISRKVRPPPEINLFPPRFATQYPPDDSCCISISSFTASSTTMYQPESRHRTTDSSKLRHLL